jgi:gamma-glutamyltranspeptidase/glutathione hydrolase
MATHAGCTSNPSATPARLAIRERPSRLAVRSTDRGRARQINRLGSGHDIGVVGCAMLPARPRRASTRTRALGALLIVSSWLVTASCKRSPPPPPPVATADALVWGPPVDAAPAPAYRTDPPENPVDAEVTGTGKTYLVASEAELASKVGRDVLASGGNAVDAAVATAFALAVVHPTAGNLGGGGFAIVRTGPGKEAALDFRETAPAAATETMYLDAAGKPTLDSLVGHRSAGVPGAVAGLWELHKKYGKKPWKDLVTPAIALATNGFTVDNFLAASIARPLTLAKLSKFPATKALWVSGAGPVGAGTVIKLPELAHTLERIAAKGADGFYKGDTAGLIVAEMKTGGGIMTAEDLASYKAIWREPLRFSYRGRSLISMPPPSSGGIVLAMTAGMLRGIELGKLAWYGADHVHRLVEVWRRAFAARNELLGDPAFVKTMPVAKLLSQDYQDKLAATIGPKATPSKNVAALIEGDHTTNLCVVDKDGMAVAMTTTLNTAFGSGVTVAGAGFLLNDEMDDFTAKPGSPNTFGLVQGVANKIEPGKRMLSSMSPTIVEDDQGQLFMVVGAGGGPRIITAVWQTISNVIDFDKHVDLAVANPRIHHQHLPDIVRVQAGALDKPTADALRGMGHTLDWNDVPREFGAVTAIVRTPTGWDGTADPRGGGAAMGDP